MNSDAGDNMITGDLRMNVLDYPKIVDDWCIFQHNTIIGDKECFFLGSPKLDRTIKLSTNIVDSVKKVLPLFDGENTKDDIDKKIKELGLQVDIDKLLAILGNNGLLEGVEGKCNNEIMIIGRPGICIHFKKARDSTKKLCRLLLRLYPVLIIVFTFLDLFLLFEHPISFLDMMSLRETGLIAIILSYFFIVAHESGHMIYAVSNDIEVDRLEVRLQWGIMPIVFVKYKGLYFIEPKKRVKLIMSGICMHLLFCLISVFMIIQTDSLIWKSIFVTNFMSIIINLCPYQMTDGYYTLCTIFDKYNIRLNILKQLANPKKNLKRSKLNLLLCFLYIVFFVSTTVAGVVWANEVSYSIEKITSIPHQVSFVLILVFFILQMFFIGIKLRKFGE